MWTIERMGREGGEFSVDVAGAKVHWPHDKDATLADFRVGDRVDVHLEGRGRERTNSAPLHARDVRFVPARADRFTGVVTVISGTSLTINNDRTGVHTFGLNADTRFRLGPLAVTAAQVRVSDRVTVRTSDDGLTARDVRVRLARFSGEVTAVNAGTLSVRDARRGTRDFSINGDTRFRIGREPATLADVHVGDRVAVHTRPSDSVAVLVDISRRD
jgi:hypothetical protein